MRPVSRPAAARADITVSTSTSCSLTAPYPSLTARSTVLAAARGSHNSHAQVVSQLQELQAQTSGVSYDEEAAHLMRFQRAYEANAQYFKTISESRETLMDMVG